MGYGRKGNGTTAMVLMDGDRTPLGVILTAANQNEVNYYRLEGGSFGGRGMRFGLKSSTHPSI